MMSRNQRNSLTTKGDLSQLSTKCAFRKKSLLVHSSRICVLPFISMRCRIVKRFTF